MLCFKVCKFMSSVWMPLFGPSVRWSVCLSVTQSFKCLFSWFFIIVNIRGEVWRSSQLWAYSKVIQNILVYLSADLAVFCVNARLCPSVRPSVRWSVGPSVRRWGRVEKWKNQRFRPCPPVRDWYWPCIRPCFLKYYSNENHHKESKKENDPWWSSFISLRWLIMENR